MPFKLKLMTYLVPDLPLELFQTYQYYLEEQLGIPTSLCVESRCDGPTAKHNPFKEGDADVAFMSSTALLRLLAENSGAEMLPIAAIHNHAKTGQKPLYFTELLIQHSRKDIYKEVKDMKGCRYTYDNEGSVDGNLTVLAHLRELGYNATFFGHTLESGSHRQSIQNVISGRADVAAVNSIVLDLYLRERPDHKDKVAIVTSLGPLPVYPVVINSKLPLEMKEKLTELFEQMHEKSEWNLALQKFNISRFTTADESLYNIERELRTHTKNLKTQPAYY